MNEKTDMQAASVDPVVMRRNRDDEIIGVIERRMEYYHGLLSSNGINRDEWTGRISSLSDLRQWIVDNK